MKNITLNWDNAKGEETNGKSLIIGQHLPKLENDDLTHIELYGLSLDIIDNSKDYRLRQLSCHSENICSDVKEIAKEDARKLLIEEIDKSLDILFDKSEMESVNNELNIYLPEENFDDEDF